MMRVMFLFLLAVQFLFFTRDPDTVFNFYFDNFEFYEPVVTSYTDSVIHFYDFVQAKTQNILKIY